MKRFFVLLLLLTACHRRPADSLAYLNSYVGKTPAAAGIWNTEPLHTQLKDLTGDQYDQFIKYMGSAGALTEDDYLYALAPVDSGCAYILVDTHTNKIYASIYTKTVIQHFQSPGEAFKTPMEIQRLLDSLK